MPRESEKTNAAPITMSVDDRKRERTNHPRISVDKIKVVRCWKRAARPEKRAPLLRTKRGTHDPTLKIVNTIKRQKNGKPMLFPQQARAGGMGSPDQRKSKTHPRSAPAGGMMKRRAI